jgi:hypothetical protein
LIFFLKQRGSKVAVPPLNVPIMSMHSFLNETNGIIAVKVHFCSVGEIFAEPLE